MFVVTHRRQAGEVNDLNERIGPQRCARMVPHDVPSSHLQSVSSNAYISAGLPFTIFFEQLQLAL